MAKIQSENGGGKGNSLLLPDAAASVVGAQVEKGVVATGGPPVAQAGYRRLLVTEDWQVRFRDG
ncbi:MAG: hypothetical protein QM784_08980 [Polyangiaceae bacterium]